MLSVFLGTFASLRNEIPWNQGNSLSSPTRLLGSAGAKLRWMPGILVPFSVGSLGIKFWSVPLWFVVLVSLIPWKVGNCTDRLRGDFRLLAPSVYANEKCLGNGAGECTPKPLPSCEAICCGEAGASYILLICSRAWPFAG
jgi:hypothetical protein